MNVAHAVATGPVGEDPVPVPDGRLSPPYPPSPRRGRAPASDVDLTAILDGIVELYEELDGRTPTKVRCYAQDELVVCVLRVPSSRVELTLVEGGRAQAVLDLRAQLQDLVRDRAVEVVRRASGRSVVGAMSGSQHDPDLVFEVFLLGGLLSA